MKKIVTRIIARSCINSFVLFLLLLSGCSSDSDNDSPPSVGQIELVSVSDVNTQLIGNKVAGSSISSNGQIISFTVVDDTVATFKSDIYVRNMGSGDTILATFGQNGSKANDESYGSDISGDGSTVAYVSYANNLISSDSNNAVDIFVFDLALQANRRASESASGVEGDSYSRYRSSINNSGRYVVFYSNATNLIDGIVNQNDGVYMKDMQTGNVTKLSVSNLGAEANGFSSGGDISADGRFVAFVSEATNLVDNDNNNARDIFLRDNSLNQIVRINISNDGQEANGASSWDLRISGNGRYVVYASSASNLVENDINRNQDIFIYDSLLGTTQLVSVNSIGEQANNFSDTPSVSEDGRFVAFMSTASNLVDGDTNVAHDVFIHDMYSGMTVRVSVSENGEEGNNNSLGPEISDDGRYIAFTSLATNLVPDPGMLESNVYRVPNPLY